VDLALESGATRVTIIEGGKRGAPFTVCGYDFFRSYDPFGRVSLVDLNFEPVSLATVPSGLAYRGLYMPQLVLDPNVVFISAAKLKMHMETAASLSMKNLFGVPPIRPYYDPEEADFRSRYHLHDRAVNQAIVDLHLVRPIDFAVVDGIWGMEGDGPVEGSPVRMDLVVAGRNSLAVDRVCLDVMAMPQDRPQHLTYATWLGLGPASMAQIALAGDGYTPSAFQQPTIPPHVWMPRATPITFSPAAGERTTVNYMLTDAAETHVDLLRTSDVRPAITLIRALRGWMARPSGIDTLTWDGRDDAGQLVPPGTYAIRVQARYDAAPTLLAAATGWVGVLA
jgi:hypothetical protein